MSNAKIDTTDYQLFNSLFNGVYELAVDKEKAIQLIANHRTVDYRLISIEALTADRDAWKAKAERYEKALSEWEEFREEFNSIQYHREGMGCGLEDRYITDRYVACEHGWDRALDKVAELIPEALYTAALQEDTP